MADVRSLAFISKENLLSAASSGVPAFLYLTHQLIIFFDFYGTELIRTVLDTGRYAVIG